MLPRGPIVSLFSAQCCFRAISGIRAEIHPTERLSLDSCSCPIRTLFKPALSQWAQRSGSPWPCFGPGAVFYASRRLCARVCAHACVRTFTHKRCEGDEVRRCRPRGELSCSGTLEIDPPWAGVLLQTAFVKNGRPGMIVQQNCRVQLRTLSLRPIRSSLA